MDIGLSSYGVSVYAPAFTGTYCAYPWKDGQAELTWMFLLHIKAIGCSLLVMWATHHKMHIVVVVSVVVVECVVVVVV